MGPVAIFAVAAGLVALALSGRRRKPLAEEQALAGLTPDTRAAIEQLLEDARAMGLVARVRSALRSCAAQHELYGVGRSYNLDSPVVTYADGCRSWHVLGRAVDLDVLPVSGYQQLGKLWESRGGGWGGRFEGFGPGGDAGHFQWPGGHTLAKLCPDPSACED